MKQTITTIGDNKRTATSEKRTATSEKRTMSSEKRPTTSNRKSLIANRTFGEALKASLTAPMRYPLNIIKRTLLTKEGLRQWFTLKYRRTSCFLIHMELSNGDHDTFVVAHHQGSFMDRGRTYIVDESCRYYHIPTRMYALDYHESFSLPIKRVIDINGVKSLIEQSGVTEVELQLNPSTLTRFVESKIAEGVMKGQQIDQFLKSIKMMIIIGLVIGIVHLLLFVVKTGMLQAIKIPGLGG